MISARYDRARVTTNETSPAVETKWPRWAWFVLPALAIALGGGLGYVVGTRDAESAPGAAPATPQPAAVQPIVEAPAAAQPDREIEMPETARPTVPGTVRRPPVVRPKQKPKPTKTRPCNVYDHMDGC